jgi:tetratricopeptide (TPR) repeat protein
VSGAVNDPASAAASGAATGFLGRRDELAALRLDIERASLDTLAGRPAPRARVLLVAGRPGAGRTALAEEFAAELLASGRYPDGLLRARLTEPGGGLVPTEHTVRELLGTLGVPAPAGAEDDELTDVLREALDERRAVLLLDDVGSAGQLDGLIPDTRHCLLIAVARGPLTGVPDVRPCTLGGLETTTAVRLLARGAGEVRVTVDPTAAARLAEECAHLPAALALAGGWLAAHPDAAVVDAVRRIGEPPEIGCGPPDRPDEDGAGTGTRVDDALRRAFAMVHAALPAPAARLLRLLVLAPAGLADAHTAAALAGCPVVMARALLADFARLGLLRPTGPALRRPAPGAAEAVGSERQYLVPGCLDPLLRELLRTREKPADALLARARMLERTVRLLRSCQAVTEPYGSSGHEWLAGLPASLRFEDRTTAADWLAARLPALLAAARLAVADGELDTLARRLVAALSRALIAYRGEELAAPELYRLHELVLGVAERQRLPLERATALLNLGDLDARAGRETDALDRYRAALEAARSQHGPPDPAAVGRALTSLGSTYAELGDWQRAADWYGRALALCQSRDDLDGAARLHGRIGTALGRAANWPEALRAWRAAAAAHRRRGDAHAQAIALAEAARVQEHAGRPDESLRTGHEALRQAERTDDSRLQAALRLLLADAAERLGQPVAAVAHRAAAERLLACSRPAGKSTCETQPSAGDI